MRGNMPTKMENTKQKNMSAETEEGREKAAMKIEKQNFSGGELRSMK